jgi:polyisoprenoid-binding protein YceI
MGAMARWIVDPDHTVAAFSIVHMMIAHVRGQFNKISGTIYYDPLNINASSVELVIDVASIYTGIRKRDDHLRSSDFFDVDKCPTISFKSTHIESTAGKLIQVTGDLHMHGRTGRITIPAKMSGPVQDPFGDGSSIGFTASIIINREDYDITWNQPMANKGFMVGSKVEILIDLEADLDSNE